MNKKWRPESWSVQARKMAEGQFNIYFYYNMYPEYASLSSCYSGRLDENFEEIRYWTNDIRYYVDYFSNSYRHKIIRERAAKHFKRLCKKYNFSRA